VRVNRLDLNLLLVFDRIVAERSVTKAARQLNLSQAAGSNALRRLRAHFDDALIVYTNGVMTLTPFGEEIRARVRHLVEQGEDLAMTRRVFDPSTSRREFAISLSEYASATIMPRVSATISIAAPNVSLELKPLIQTRDGFLERNESDYIIYSRVGELEKHPYRLLYEDDYVCIAWSGHKPEGSALSLDEYANSTHVICRPIKRDVVADNLATVHESHAKRTAIITPYQFLLPSLLVGTPHLACVYRRIAEKAQSDLPITIMELPFEFPPTEVCIFWNHARAPDPSHEWLLGIFTDACASLSRPRSTRRNPKPAKVAKSETN
jgi:DNA-binding transcriptional LysR family regulator